MQEFPEEHFVGLVNQKIVCLQQGMVLMVRNKGELRWDLPGGRLHANEDPIVGLHREITEELGCDREMGSVLACKQKVHAAANMPCLYIFYRAAVAGEIILAPDELDEWAWIDPVQLQSSDTFTDYLDVLKLALK